MKRWILWIAAVLLAVLPVCAAEETAAEETMILHFGDTFSFSETHGEDAQAATALYEALSGLEPGMIFFDELSFAGDETVLVSAEEQLDFRFTSLSHQDLCISMGEEDGLPVCTVTVMDAFVPEPMPTVAVRAISEFELSPRVQLDCGADAQVLANVALAAESIYDFTLTSGDIFSFNGVIGPLEARYGYAEAPNGCGETVIGGGADQVASAIWLLVQNRPDVSIVQKATYGGSYNQSYVASSADAILVDYASGTDFAFRYNGRGSMTLYPTLEGSILTVTLAFN